MSTLNQPHWIVYILDTTRLQFSNQAYYRGQSISWNYVWSLATRLKSMQPSNRVFIYYSKFAVTPEHKPWPDIAHLELIALPWPDAFEAVFPPKDDDRPSFPGNYDLDEAPF